MPYITLHNLSYSTPSGHWLFKQLNLTFAAEKTAIIGANGIGKSTLLRLISGELTPSAGSIDQQATLAVLPQFFADHQDKTVADLLAVQDGLARLQRIEQGWVDLNDLAEADWTLPQRLEQVLRQVGLADLALTCPLSSLSGGQQTRIALAALLFQPADILILDEPSNNLDREGRQQVVNLLNSWRGGAIIVSHDRDLLRQVDRIIELSSLGVHVYGGNWDEYLKQRTQEKNLAAQQLACAQRKVKEVERKVQLAKERQARRDSAGQRAQRKGGQNQMFLDSQAERAEHSQSKGSKLQTRLLAAATETLQQSKTQVEQLKPLSMRINSCGLAASKTVLKVENLVGGADPQQRTINPLSFTLTGPERVAIVGPNGSGKTTLLRLINGELSPLSGTIHCHVTMAMLDQQIGLLQPDQSVAENFQRLNPQAKQNACRAALARFLFRADAALKLVSELSGGEKLRAGLACVIGAEQPAQLLLLDEPTNHVDFDALSAIEAGLNGYDGALLLVSHDETFLQAVGIQRRIELGKV